VGGDLSIGPVVGPSHKVAESDAPGEIWGWGYWHPADEIKK